MTCSDSHHICNRCAFLALMIIITSYCLIRIFCRAKNNLRIFRGSKYQKIKNIKAQQKIKYSYKKRVYCMWLHSATCDYAKRAREISKLLESLLADNTL